MFAQFSSFIYLCVHRETTRAYLEEHWTKKNLAPCLSSSVIEQSASLFGPQFSHLGDVSS